MGNYNGVYFHNLDAKNIMFIPAKFREALGESFYVFRSPDNCLFLYDEEGWQRTSEKVIEDSSTVEGRKKQREVFGRISPVEMDKQGRITLSAPCVSHAGLSKDIVIIGMGKRIEIWDLERWNSNEELDSVDISEGIEY